MHALRRHSRRLLLPPGWVALGFLLLLGCQALLANRRQMQRYGVMQLAMPALKPNKEFIYWMRQHKQSYTDYSQLSVKELNKLRPWHDAEFTGIPFLDFFNEQITQDEIEAMQANSCQAGGVRIRFSKQATYENLVDALDIMNITNQAKYWLDIIHKPVTLYAITDKSSPHYSSRLTAPPCGGMSYYLPLTKCTLRQNFASLWQQPWQPVTLLIASIAALSLYRLARPRPSLR